MLRRIGGGSERVIDKMPDNILHLGLAAVLFPGARVIFCRRDSRDICLSCYFHHFGEPIPYAQDLADCARRALRGRAAGGSLAQRAAAAQADDRL